MIHVNGNMWRDTGDAFVVTTNGIVKRNGAAVMGAGVALYARETFPGIDMRLGQLLKQHGNRVFNMGTYESPVGKPQRVVTFPTKKDWKDPSDPNLILKSCAELIEMTDEFGWSRVILPPVGTGNGGLNTEYVREMLEPILDNRFVVYGLMPQVNSVHPSVATANRA
jgi:hypothetical protein